MATIESPNRPKTNTKGQHSIPQFSGKCVVSTSLPRETKTELQSSRNPPPFPSRPAADLPSPKSSLNQPHSTPHRPRINLQHPTATNKKPTPVYSGCPSQNVPEPQPRISTSWPPFQCVYFSSLAFASSRMKGLGTGQSSDTHSSDSLAEKPKLAQELLEHYDLRSVSL